MSQYIVPSQSQHMELKEPDMNILSYPRQGQDAWNDYSHNYSRICKMVDKHGEKGREAFLKGFNAIRIEQTDIMGPTVTARSGSVGLKLSTKRKAIQKAKAIGPQKKKNK